MSCFSFDEDLFESRKDQSIDIGEYDPNNKEILDEEQMNKQCQKLTITENAFNNCESGKQLKCGPQDFDIISVLGKGGYGTVYLVKKHTEPRIGQLYAMKVLKKAVIYRSNKDIIHTKSERNILETIQHPFIVSLIYAFQTNNKLYMIMEYLSGGELFMQLERNGSLPVYIARFYLAEIVLALIHLHENGIIYRDLKPENIMLTNTGHIKLTDFGLSKESMYADDTTNTFCGTIEYMAPEILTRTGHGPTADWWSLGTVLYDMLAGEPPFSAASRDKTMTLILKGRLVVHHFFTPEAKDLLKQLLRRDPRYRLGYGRYGAEELKDHIFFKGIDWDDLYHLRIQPPYIPPIENKYDTSMFDARFTELPAKETPCNTLTDGNDDVFLGFSYVASSVMNESGQFNNSNNKANTFYEVFGQHKS